MNQYALSVVESSALINCKDNSGFVSLIRGRDELRDTIEAISRRKVEYVTIATENKKVTFRLS